MNTCLFMMCSTMVMAKFRFLIPEITKPWADPCLLRKTIDLTWRPWTQHSDQPGGSKTRCERTQAATATSSRNTPDWTHRRRRTVPAPHRVGFRHRVVVGEQLLPAKPVDEPSARPLDAEFCLLSDGSEWDRSVLETDTALYGGLRGHFRSVHVHVKLLRGAGLQADLRGRRQTRRR